MPASNELARLIAARPLILDQTNSVVDNAEEDRIFQQILSSDGPAVRPHPESRTRRSLRTRPSVRPTVSGRAVRRRAATAAVVGVALAIGLTAAVVSNGGRATRAPVAVTVAADFLDRAAATTQAQPVPPRNPHELYYVKELVNATPSFPGQLAAAVKTCEVNWGLPQSIGEKSGWTDVRIPTRPAPRFCAAGIPAPPHGYLRPWLVGPGYPSWDQTAYPLPATLPTNPAALRAALYRAAKRTAPGGGNLWGINPIGDNGKTVVVFILVDRLLQVPLSAQLRSALFAVTATLPGIELIRNAADAAGRRGVEIAITTNDTVGLPEKSCLAGVGISGFVLNPSTYQYLGERDVTTYTRQRICKTPHSEIGRMLVPRSLLLRHHIKLQQVQSGPSAAVVPARSTTFTTTAVLATGFVQDAGRRSR